MEDFGFSNYLSFGDNKVEFRDIKKLNILIGKNNCGKSNILKFLNGMSGLYNKENVFIDKTCWHLGGPQAPKLHVRFTLSELGFQLSNLQANRIQIPGQFDKIKYPTTINLSTNEICLPSPFMEYPDFDRQITNFMTGKSSNKVELCEKITNQARHTIKNALKSQFSNIFYVPQFREFRLYGGDRGLRDDGFEDVDNVAGYKLAERLAWMKSPGVEHNKEQQKFYRIIEWIRELLDLPDLVIEFEDISGSYPRSVILNINGLRRYLSDFGTGIHQLVILCFALAIRDNSVICIEEPEQFLHPGLQRKFIQFLRGTSNIYFITTHSSVFLDSSSYSDSNVYHINYAGTESACRLIQTTPDAYKVLDELQAHASDLMQANGIIWVEGPTDRMYLLKWLELMNSNYKEGVHFIIMFYGGSLLSHIGSTAESNEQDRLIPLLKINRNVVFIMDSDRKKKRARLAKSKINIKDRVSEEISSTNGFIWTTKGREIENYVPEAVWIRFASKRYAKYRVKWDQYNSSDDFVKHGKTLQAKFNYSKSKVKYTREIVEEMVVEDLNCLDLKANLKKLLASIRKWNPSVDL